MDRKKLIHTAPCPGCNATRGHATEAAQVYECGGCGAIYGSCYQGEASKFYTPVWHEGETRNVQDERYVDLTILSSAGVRRFHGWIHRDSKRITQTG